MRKILFKILFGCAVLVSPRLRGQSIDSYVIFKDLCEVLPSFTSWTNTPKTVGWETWTYGLQNINSQATWEAYGYIKKVTQGQYGAPAARHGTGSYKMFLRKRLDYPNAGGGENWVRSELYWGNGCGENVGATDFMMSIYIPTSFCFDTRPVGVGFDFKFCDAIGPASFYLKIEDGMWQPTRQYPQGTTEYRDYLDAFPEFVNVERGKWYDILIKRNFKSDGSGFMQMYMHKEGGTAGFTKVWEHLGANYVGTDESYLVQGIYKWSWKNPSGQNEGPGNACGNDSISVIYDDFYMTRTAPLSVWNNVISGTSTPTHVPPSTNAGNDQTITLPDTDAVMSATTSAGTSAILARTWQQVSGPNTAVISNAAIEDPTMSGLIAGTYVFRLTTADVDEYSTSDQVVVVVQSAPGVNLPYFTNSVSTPMAQRDTTILDDADSVRMSFFAQAYGSGYIQSLLIEQIGTTPSVADFNYDTDENLGFQPSHLYMTIRDLTTIGTYAFKITATDGDGNIKLDTVNVFVIASATDPPVVDVGSDKYLVVDGFGPYPLRNTTLIGSVTAGDGAITAKKWRVINGPENSVLGSDNRDTTTLANIIRGIYTVRYTATDANNLSGYDEINVTVLSVDAGSDQTITLPDNSVILEGFIAVASDTTNVLWEKISGTGGSVAQSGQLSTNFSGLIAGTYELQLTVTWNIGGNIYLARDRITVAVLPSGTQVNRRVNKP